MTSNMDNSSLPRQQPDMTQAAVARRARISYACEACRAAKVKCQPSLQPGICKRCSDSKRECIFKTGPRTRRPRKKFSSTPSTPRAAPPPPPGPSKTFTIDIPMQDEFEDLAANLEDLRLSHEMHVADLVPEDDEYASYSEYTDDDEDGEGEGASSSQHRTGSVAGASSASHASSLPVGASALSTPPSSVSYGKSAQGRRKGALASLGLRPQFNLDSAEKLLVEFETRMLLHFPAVAPLPFVSEDAGDVDGAAGFTVPRLAKTKPFVLLAILAAASGSRTLQGHSLYDDEFRKILGLKFVAGGERSLELLQGLVVYTAWYPFHLRPRARQSLQYVRMVVDIVNDLELDQDPDGENNNNSNLPAQKCSDARLEQVRTYLATYYLVCSYAAAWNRVPALFYTKYTAKCCDLLERDGAVRGDHILAWHIRIQHILEQVSQLRKTKIISGQNEYQISLMLKGMESQLGEWEGRMPPEVLSTPSIRLSLLFTKIFIPAAPLLKLPMPKSPRPTNQNAFDPITFVADTTRLTSVVADVRRFFDEVLTYSAAELNSFSGTEWSRFILIVILGFRLSFPLVENPEWDHGWARRELEFGGYMKRFEELGGGEENEGSRLRGNMDVLNASKVVLGVVRKKWEARKGRLERGKGKGKGVAGTGAGAGAVPEQQQGQGQAGEMFPQMGMGGDMGGMGGGGDGIGMTGDMDPMVLDKSMHGCPMIDGSLEEYYPLWDESFSSAGMDPMGGMMGGLVGDQSGAGAQDGPSMPADEYADVWSTMTGQWPEYGAGYGGGHSQ